MLLYFYCKNTLLQICINIYISMEISIKTVHYLLLAIARTFSHTNVLFVSMFVCLLFQRARNICIMKTIFFVIVSKTI